jgi:hypothetical protein
MEGAVAVETRRIYVWYDAEGTITALGYAPEQADRKRQVIPRTAAARYVLETEIAVDVLAKLHETHCVDVQQKVLIADPRRQ